MQFSGGLKDFGYNFAYAERFSNDMTAIVGEEADPFKKVNFNVGLSGELFSKIDLRFNWNRDNIEADFDNSFPYEQSDFSYTTEVERFSLSSIYNYEEEV